MVRRNLFLFTTPIVLLWIIGGDCCGEPKIIVTWRADGRCGKNFPMNGSPSKCNPDGIKPCCSNQGWCGYGDEFCNCIGCHDYVFAHNKCGSKKKCKTTCRVGNRMHCNGCYGCPIWRPLMQFDWVKQTNISFNKFQHH